MRRFVHGRPSPRLQGLRLARQIYIPPSQTHGHARRQEAGAAMRLNKEAALLDAQLRDLKQRERHIQNRIKEQKDIEKQQKVAQVDNAELTLPASAEDIAALEQSVQKSDLRLFGKGRAKSPLQLLPKSLRVLFAGEQVGQLQLFKPQTLSWVHIVNKLATLEDIEHRIDTIAQPEMEKFVASIPLKERASLIVQLERLVPENRRSQFMKDAFMAAYAERCDPLSVERILSQCSKPTEYSFGHLAKSYFKSGAPSEKVLDVIRRMTAAGHSPNLQVYSGAVQSLIQHKRYNEAEKVFDNLKYLSVSTQPDTKLYNTMMLAAAKKHNVNRVLDLFSEMKSRRPFPLEPTAETYSVLVYACARDPKTHLLAWELFTEALSNGLEADRDSFRALLYLCGSTGEVMLARALVRRLLEREDGAKGYLVDEFVLNSLFLAYKNWAPGPSKILNTPNGNAIRAHILMDATAPPLTVSLPLLPVAQLNEGLILAESNAVMEYCADTRPQALRVSNRASSAKLRHSPVVFNYLQVVIRHNGGIEEFKRRFNRFTELERATHVVKEEPETHANLTLARDQDFYRLAIRACIKFQDLSFAREVWMERGEWRKTDAFRRLPQGARNRLDFQFARDIVEVLSVCGQVDEALLVLRSAANLGAWRRHHVAALLALLERLEDTRAVSEVYKTLQMTCSPPR